MDLHSLKIDLKGLKTRHTNLELNLDDSYFELIDSPEIEKGNLHVSIDIEKTANDRFVLNFHETGAVTVPCNICLDPMEQSIDTEQSLEVKFGIESPENENLVTIPENEGMLDVTWFIYEFMILAIPIRHVHAPGKCNPAMISALQEYAAARSGEDNEENIDPRWATLSKLKE